MGTECVRYSPKLSPQISHHRSSQSSRVKSSDEKLHFEIIISDLELHCTANNVGKVVFTVQNFVNIQFLCAEFLMLDKMIRCTSTKRASFSVYAKQIEFLEFTATILDTKGAKIEKVCLKMHAVCQGPKHHDHLLKQMKARIIYNLEVTQLVSAIFGCSDYKIYDINRNDLSQNYALTLDMIVPKQDESKPHQKKIFITRNPQQQSEKYIKNNFPSNKLKESIFRIMIYKTDQSGLVDLSQPPHQICIPYMKFWTQDQLSVTSEKTGQKVFQKITLKHYERIKEKGQFFINILLNLSLKVTRIQLQQIECLVFSQNGLKTVSPYLLSQKSTLIKNCYFSLNDLQIYQNLFKKQKKVTYQTKNQIQKAIKQCYNYLNQQCKDKVGSPSELQKVQVCFLNILNILNQLITQGQDVTNESIWMLIDKIIHRPELTINYLHLIKDQNNRVQIGLKFYGFIFAMLSKIILCTTMGLTYHELKCIQKFIGYVFFRCKWIRDQVIKAIHSNDDPQFTSQKLMEIGVCYSNKSPSKSFLYEWQQCLLPYIKNDHRYREISNNLIENSQSVPNWASFLFNREDQDLYYGLLIQIWNQAQIFLNNQGKIMWQYFPGYAQLLSSFLGQMNRNKIVDYSNLFRLCSMKLISNEKLLNNFVMFLFPKTCLYEINCVLNCLQLIHSYFEVISKNNKKMPSDFNFNYFYTGIKSIFQSNHSYLLIRVIGLLYNYYSIFSFDFKRSLDGFIFSKAFNLIFLHWCDHVRRMFYLLLQHRIVLKFHEYQLGQFDDSQRNSISFQIIQRKHQYRTLIQSLKLQQELLLKATKNTVRVEKDCYYLRMKQKLKLKKLQVLKTKQPKKLQKFDTLQLEYSPHLLRKQTQCGFIQMETPRNVRKWSGNYEISEKLYSITDDLKKYLKPAMKQYRQILLIQNPDEQIKKVLKIFDGNKSVDN